MSNPPSPLLAGVDFLHGWFVTVANHLQSPVLFVIRFVIGIQLMEAGFGKLLNISTPIGYFTSLGIPFPVENAWLVAFTETFGGLFLAFGFLTRLTSFPLIINFIVAYLTTEQDSLKKLSDLSHFPDLNTDAFFAAAPFLFLATAVLMLAFGPGALSVDYVLVTCWRKREWRGPKL